MTHENASKWQGWGTRSSWAGMPASRISKAKADRPATPQLWIGFLQFHSVPGEDHAPGRSSGNPCADAEGGPCHADPESFEGLEESWVDDEQPVMCVLWT